MVCYAPLTAYRSNEIGKSGKRGMTFVRSAAHTGVKYKLPCGQCSGCRLEYSRQWAMRCMHEKQMHTDNSFLTFTYSNDKLPLHGSLVKRDLVLGLKRLHNYLLKERGYGIRYYAGGEYGERTFRPHYHIICFGFEPWDKVFYKYNKRGEPLYTSKFCDDRWQNGFVTVGDVTFDSCAYVARYVLDKRTGPHGPLKYDRVLDSGEIVSLVPEFSIMSRRPGIGKEWFAKYGEHAYKWDSVIMNGREVRPPRFYDFQYEALDASRLAAIKVTRRSNALKHRENNTPDRRRVRERVHLAKLSLNKREF